MDLYKRSLKPKEAIRNDSRQEFLERALSGALSALRDDVQSPANYVRLSRACYGLDRADEALAALERGLDLCPPSLRLYREYIVALRILNRTPDAINVAQRALKQFPDDLLLKLVRPCPCPFCIPMLREVEFYRQRFGEGLVRLSVSCDCRRQKIVRELLEGSLCDIDSVRRAVQHPKGDNIFSIQPQGRRAKVEPTFESRPVPHPHGRVRSRLSKDGHSLPGFEHRLVMRLAPRLAPSLGILGVSRCGSLLSV